VLSSNVVEASQNSTISPSVAGTGPDPSLFSFQLFSQGVVSQSDKSPSVNTTSPARPPLPHQLAPATTSRTTASSNPKAARQPASPFSVPKPSSSTSSFSPPVVSSQLLSASGRRIPSTSRSAPSDPKSQVHRLCNTNGRVAQASLLASASASSQGHVITTENVTGAVGTFGSITRCTLGTSMAPLFSTTGFPFSTPLHRTFLRTDLVSTDVDPVSSARDLTVSRKALLDVTNNPTYTFSSVSKHCSADAATVRLRKLSARGEAPVMTDPDLGSSGNPIVVDFD
jgi:hypothetical protein